MSVIAPSEISVSDTRHTRLSTTSTTITRGGGVHAPAHTWQSLFDVETTSSLCAARPRDHQPTFFTPNAVLFPVVTAASLEQDLESTEVDEEQQGEHVSVASGSIAAAAHTNSSALRGLLPSSVSSFYETLLKDERLCTLESKQHLEESWKAVEALIDKNKLRHAAIHSDLDALLTTAVIGSGSTSLFDNNKNKNPSSLPETLANNADSPLSPPKQKAPSSSSTAGDNHSGAEGEDVAGGVAVNDGVLIWDRDAVLNAFSERLVLDDFLAMLTGGANTENNSDKSTTRTGHDAMSIFSNTTTTKTNATAVSAATSASRKAKELVMNQQSAAHTTAPIRRIFKPLLERRSVLPKELTLLLNAVESMQSTDFLALEATLQKSPVAVPVHTPLQRIAQFIGRVLAKPSPAATREQLYVQRMKPVLKQLEQDYTSLSTLWTEEDVTSEKKMDATVQMWKALFQEICTRHSIDGDWDQLMKDCEASDAELHATLPAALEQCVSDVKTDIANLRGKASNYSKKSVDSASSTELLLKEIDDAYKSDSDALNTAINGIGFQVNQSHARQEKCLRKIRELQKSFLREQQACELHTAELVDRKVKRALVETAYTQLKAALVEHCEAAEIARKASEAMDSCLIGMETAAQKILTECRKHVGRITSEEHFRLCRIADYGMQNALQWYRATHDVEQLFEARNNHVLEKSDASWQLGYLLTQERMHCQKNLSRVRDEFTTIDSSWARITSFLEKLSLPTISLFHSDSSERHMRLRMILKSVDDDGTVSKSFLLMFDEAMIQQHNLLTNGFVDSHQQQPRQNKEEAQGGTASGLAKQPQPPTPAVNNSNSTSKVVLPSINNNAVVAASAPSSAKGHRSASSTSAMLSLQPVGLTPRPPARDPSKTVR